MSYIDARMPERIAAGFRIGPDWSTLIVPMDNGREQRNKQWLYPKYRGTAQVGAFNAADRNALLGLFHVAGGRHKAFRVKDPTDWRVSNEPCAPVVGTSTPLQLARAYIFGTESSTRLIQAPHAGTVVVRKDGAPVTVTVDSLTGLVTPSSPWAAGVYTFDCDFDMWMRFDSDWGSFTAVANGVWTAEFDLVEVRR